MDETRRGFLLRDPNLIFLSSLSFTYESSHFMDYLFFKTLDEERMKKLRNHDERREEENNTNKSIRDP